jgi:uncharacterized repeat protein (TIGR02059 family)
MAAYVQRASWFGWAGGGLQAEKSAAAPAAGVNVNITYARALRAAPAFAQFTATVNGVSRGVTGASVAGAVLTVVLASAVAASDIVVVTYAPGATPATRLAYSDGTEFGPGSISVKAA